MDIRVDGLTKTFQNKKVLDNISLRIEKNNITCIMGPSGCGKTTLLRIFIGLDKAYKGLISGLEDESVSVVFQEERLCEKFTALANVKMVCDNEVSIENVEKHFKEVGLEDINKKPVSKLSGGMRRRVSIVRAILAKADIIIMDEPFKGLDEDNKDKVIDYIKKYTKNKTVIITTHSVDEVEKLKATLIKM